MPQSPPLPRRSRLARLPLAPLRSLPPLLVAIALGLVACSKQAEGERCDPNNGPYDCERGLECKRASELNIEGRGVGLCCPPTGIAPSVDACRANATLPEEEGPADAGEDRPDETDAGDGADPEPAPSDAGGDASN